MTTATFTCIEKNLKIIFDEIKIQTNVKSYFSPEFLDFEGCMVQINEFIEVAEYGLAYEFLVGLLELYPFILSGLATVSLLEVGLLFGFKTNRNKDLQFDRRVSK